MVVAISITAFLLAVSVSFNMYQLDLRVDRFKKETLTERLENQRHSIKDLQKECSTLQSLLSESEKNREHKSKRINELMATNHDLTIRCGELKKDNTNISFRLHKAIGDRVLMVEQIKELQLENAQLIAKCVKLDDYNEKLLKAKKQTFFKNLLKKYISHIEYNESINYLSELKIKNSAVNFTKEEIKQLKKLVS